MHDYFKIRYVCNARQENDRMSLPKFQSTTKTPSAWKKSPVYNILEQNKLS